MTTEFEEEFFDIFGIDAKNRFKGCKLGAKYYSEICDEPSCNGCDDEIREIEYPQITDCILLELICICSQYGFCPTARNIKDLKLKVLKRLLELKKNLKNYYKHQDYHNAFARKVRTLFEDR